MATCTHAITTTSTANGTSYTTGAFTPAAGDLLVMIVAASDTNFFNTVTNSDGITFTNISGNTFPGSFIHILYMFVANSLANAVSQTCTFDCTGGPATGTVISVLRISGMSKTGSSVILQTGNISGGTAGTTPTPVFASSALTGNVTIGAIANVTNPATMTPPTGWTEQSDAGYNTPTIGMEYVTRDSGFAGTTITWGNNSATGFASTIVEFDTSNSNHGNFFPFFERIK